jgi:glycosyltransferase involved in cell wall biosynthesis
MHFHDAERARQHQDLMKRLVREMHERFIWEPVHCVMCGTHGDLSLAFEKWGVAMSICNRCNHLFVNPRMATEAVPFLYGSTYWDNYTRAIGSPTIGERVVFDYQNGEGKLRRDAIRALAAAKRRGLNVRLTLLGRDVADASGRSTWRDTLLPLAQQLGLDFGDFRFVEQRDEADVVQHLHNSDCVILPSRFENLHTAAIEALASGVPAITGRRSGLRHWVSDDDGVRTIPTENADAFAEATADALSDRRWLIEAGGRGRRRVTEVFEPESATRRHLEFYEQLVGTAKPFARRSGARAVEGPELAIIILAHNALSYTKRCVQSLIAHTQTPLRIYLVDNGSTDGTAEWAAKVSDPLTLIRSEVNLGVSGGRNLGLKSIIGNPEYIVFLDNDVEVMAGWWQPFAGALAANRDVAIAGERGVVLEFHREGRTERPLIGPGPQDADMAIGFCMFMRPSAVRQIGSFDQNLGLFWHDDDDFGLRARRLGYRVLHMATGRILHFEHKSSSTVAEIWNAPEKPSELSDRNQRYLRDKYSIRHGALRDARAFVVLAIADEVLESPTLLQAYAGQFSAADDVTLVIYAPDRKPHEVQMMLEPVLVAAGLDSDEAADIIAVPVPSSRDHEIILAQSVDAVLCSKDPAGVFHAPPHFVASEIHQLRDLARRRLDVVSATGEQLSEPAAA